MANSILCVHLLDDFSGSAKVFSTVVDILRRGGHQTEILIGTQGDDGFIRRKHAVRKIPYRFHTSKLLLLFSYLLSQLWLFFSTCRMLLSGRADMVYVNTVLPFGAVLAAAVCRRPVITHVHEVGMGSRTLFRFLRWTIIRFSTRLIAVSDYVVESLKLPRERTTVIHNALDDSEWKRASDIYQHKETTSVNPPLRVLMACSLKWYKGIDQFIGLSRACKALPVDPSRKPVFTLVLNCELQELSAFKGRLLPDDDIEIIHRPASVYDHYLRAGLVLNLSLPEGWIETFGLTLLEAMSCGVPVVSPTVGGCLELFHAGQGGWHIDARDTAALVARVHELSSNADSWRHASRLARTAATNFSPDMFSHRITGLFSSL
jgi:glycosyltransferase involved in cell wall biosynthesis